MTTVKEITLEILQPMISSNHKDSFWYEGTVAKVAFENRLVHIISQGENRWRDPESGRIISLPYQLTENEFSKGDDFLYSILTDDGWIYNSWFTLDCFLDITYKEYTGDVAFSYDEAIEMAKDIIVNDDWWEDEV